MVKEGSLTMVVIRVSFPIAAQVSFTPQMLGAALAMERIREESMSMPLVTAGKLYIIL